LNGGYAYNSGNFGTNGFNVGAAWWFTNRVTMAANYDATWNSTSLTTFQFTQIGAISLKSHPQNFLVGPRIFFSTKWTDKIKLNPFGEVQFGVSHLSQKLIQVNKPTVSASDTEFSWLLGAGVDYLLTSHWSARANLDLLRTHFANAGQSHFRLVLGITYTFGSRQQKTGPQH
jgi:opacity protein-like surface antigen